MSENQAPVPEAGAASLSPEVAAMALAFLTRPNGGATIHVSEVDAFLRVRVALEVLAMKSAE